MLHIFLVILKIIGIILLVLLGIVILLVLSFLFIPFRYDLSGRIYEKESYESGKTVADGVFRASFLGFLIRLKVVYKEDYKWNLRICGIKIMSQEDSDRNIKNKSEDILHDAENSVKSESQNIMTAMESKTEPETDNISHKTSKRNSHKKGFFNKIKGKTENFFEKINSFFRSLKDNVKKILDFVSYIRNLFDDYRFKNACKFILDKILFVLKKVSPHIKKADFKFGFDDPSVTGKVLGGICAFSGITGMRIMLDPDFNADKFYVDGVFILKGKIMMCHLVKLVYYYFFNDEVKYVKYKLQKSGGIGNVGK